MIESDYGLFVVNRLCSVGLFSKATIAYECPTIAASRPEIASGYPKMDDLRLSYMAD